MPELLRAQQCSTSGFRSGGKIVSLNSANQRRFAICFSPVSSRRATGEFRRLLNKVSSIHDAFSGNLLFAVVQVQFKNPLQDGAS